MKSFNPINWFKSLFESSKELAETPSLRQVRRHLQETTPTVHKTAEGSWVVLEVEEVDELSRKVNEDKMEEREAEAFVAGWNHCKQYTLGLKRSVVREQSREVKQARRRKTEETKLAAKNTRHANNELAAETPRLMPSAL